MNLESGVIGKLLVAGRAAETRSIFGLVECTLEMGQNVLLQRTVRDEAATTRSHRAFEGRLTGVGQTVQVQAFLGHTAVATKITLNLPRGASSPLPSSTSPALVLCGGTALQVDLQNSLVYELG